MEWIDETVEFPEDDQILCCGNGQVFICELVESKWGNFYRSTDWCHRDKKQPEWTHWMKMPKPPEKK